jgi:serine/threonine protein kinase
MDSTILGTRGDFPTPAARASGVSDPDGFETRRRLRFELLREVNRGGMGLIESALDPFLGRRVAIKTLREELLQDERVAIKFEEEAQITGQLEHPNIVPIYEIGEDGHEPFIVMKLIRGRSLGDLLRVPVSAPQDPIGLQRFVAIVLKLCDALEYAHSRGVYHCDLKPDNVMVGDFGQVYLMDWGVALLESKKHRLTPESAPGRRFSIEHLIASDRDSLIRVTGPDDAGDPVRGTPAYMASEQLWGRTEEIDARTDVFGIGAILCEILTGRPPNEWDSLPNIATRKEPIELPDGTGAWTRLPPELRRITRKALHPLRDQRHPDIASLRGDLEQFMRGGGWFDTRSFAPGEVIVKEGDAGDSAYIIEEGHCQVFKNLHGRRELVRTLGPGDVFGEISVFAGGPRTATIQAADAVKVKIIGGDSLNHELDQNPWLGAFVRSLATLFRETDARLSDPPAPAR